MAAVDTGAAPPIERIQELTEQLETVTDPRARAIAEELTTAVVQMYGAGLERIVGLLDDAAVDALGADEVVAGLLLIHDLHPVPLADRVGQALERVRPYMESHGGDVELLGIEDGIARLALHGSCKSCRASSATLELAVRQALEELCPDLGGMDVEGLAAEPELAGFPGVALPMAGEAAAPRWHDVDGLAELAEQQLRVAQVAGVPLVVANVEGTLLAYRDRCAGCGAALGGGELVGPTLVCPACARGYVLTRAGHDANGGELQLEPVPLLRDAGGVRVALVT
jgi:Fe-S cluster biogenesis protein NfuA/nitrite reductase/ring-hydroxylating ferredoxin subunit